MTQSYAPPSFDHWFDHWQHPQVRDLAWLLEAPDLLTLEHAKRPSLAELGLAEPDVRQRFLAQLENSPEQLSTTFGDTSQQKLGLYHESLWQLLLSSAPGTRLLANNLPIIDNRRTLGELDLLYSCRDTGLPIHLEVTVKYYLGLPLGPGAANSHSRWIGPDGKDSLARKSTRLHQHQLPIAHTRQAREAITQHLGMCPPGQLSQRLATPGVLFYPLEGNLPTPQHVNLQHLKGRWLHWQHWQDLIATLPTGMRGAWLQKPYWLAPPPPHQLAPLAQLKHQLTHHFNNKATPVQLALRYPNGYPGGIPHNWLRVFIVNDTWPQQIPLPPQSKE
ncbi:DUF1853 family protein [Halomonas halocynthiae]|uniref:DUF1853 family protein n=1 Tax=Halomonas halocynthiae TaxID=176290 RepID=UPI00041F0515|nr:DUF1853 family protein [Halomonas halocynthiae]